MTRTPHTAPAGALRSAIYAAIRRCIDSDPRRLPRSVVVHVLAAMAAEQAELVAEQEPHSTT